MSKGKYDGYVPTTMQIKRAFQYAWLKDKKRSQRLVNRMFNAWFLEVKARAWDEGRNALPVYGEDHDVYCSEYECHCDLYTNPYRQGETK